MEYVTIISFIFGAISALFATYERAVIVESKKRRTEIQYLLAGIGNTATSKQIAWNNQISLLPPPDNKNDTEVYKAHVRARDDLLEIYGLVSALEGTVDSTGSASTRILEKNIKQAELNKRLQQLSSEIFNRPTAE